MTDFASGSSTGADTGAPWHLWVVGGLVVLWDAFGAFDFTATVTHFAPYMSNFPEEMLEYYYGLPLWMFVVWGIAVWGGLLGAILVLLRSKHAVPVLAISFLTVIVSMATSFIQPAPEGAETGVVLPIVVIGIAAVILGYAWWMARRGVLR